MSPLIVQAASVILVLLFFFFNDTATTEIYTLSLHDALPIFEGIQIDGSLRPLDQAGDSARFADSFDIADQARQRQSRRSEEHTSELQSLAYLVCRLLLEKKKKDI